LSRKTETLHDQPHSTVLFLSPMLPNHFHSQHHAIADATDTLPITVTEQQLQHGVDGVLQTLREAERLVKRDVSDKLIQRIVRTLRGDDEYDTMRNIYRFVVDNFDYITDDNIRRLLMRLNRDNGEKQFEVLTAPRHLIRHCNYQGCPTNDCDEFSLLLNNMALVSNLVNDTNFKPAFKVIGWRLDAFIPGTSTIAYTHVYSTIYVPDKKRWVPMDAVMGRTGFDYEKDPAIVQRHLIYHLEPEAGRKKIETYVNKAFKGKPQKAKPKGSDSLMDHSSSHAPHTPRPTTSHSPTLFSSPMSTQYFGLSENDKPTLGTIVDQAHDKMKQAGQEAAQKASTALSTVAKPKTTATSGTTTSKATGSQQSSGSGMTKTGEKSEGTPSTGFDISKPENMAIVGGGVAVAIVAGILIARSGKGKKSGSSKSGKAGSKKSGKKGRTLSDPASPAPSAPVAKPTPAPAASAPAGMSDGKRRSKKRKPKSAAPKKASAKKAAPKKASATKRKKSTAKR